MRDRLRSERGFALLEILVALVVLALGMGAISTGVAVAMRSDGRAQSNRIALRVALSRLEAAGITETLALGQRNGRTENKYRWLETVSPVQSEQRPPATAVTTPLQAMPINTLTAYWVEVVVQAPDGTVAKLSAIKLAPGAVP